MEGSPIDPKNDPLWKIAEKQQEGRVDRIFQQHQAWSSKEKYYQARIANYIGVTIPRKIFDFLYEHARAVVLVYLFPLFGVGIAAIAFYAGWYWQQRLGGFSQLDAASYAFVVIALSVAAVAALAALGTLLWGFFTMTWVGQLLALFYVYSWGILLIHRLDYGLNGLRLAWFLGIVISTVTEGGWTWLKNKKSGFPNPI